MVSAHTLLCCPLCKGDIDETLKCSSCGERYDLMEGVYVMISSKLTHEEWRWNRSGFSQEKMAESGQQYKSYVNKETREAKEIWLSERERSEKVDLSLTNRQNNCF